MRLPWNKKESLVAEEKSASLESILKQIAALYETYSGVTVNPETCMQSPTVHAIVTAVQNRLSISPVRVMRKTERNGRDYKEPLPNHPIARLLKQPNGWQTPEEYFGDMASTLLRWGGFYAFIGRGQTGPIRELVPMHPSQTEVEQDVNNLSVSFRYNGRDQYTFRQVHYVRLGSRNFYKPDSPILDVRESIGLEIAAEKFAGSFFGNGAMPLLYFKLMQGFADFKTDEEKVNFLRGVKDAFGGGKKFSTMMLPKGMEIDSIKVENDKAQFIETRKFIRTVIAGAFGVPPHLVGDLERATFNNVEQQDTDFTLNVVMPIAKRIEAAMERDLLTDDDRRNGIVLRFNLDSVQRADIKTRNESLRVAREWGAINVNEWREHLNLNPISIDDGGEQYIRPLNMAPAGQQEINEDEQT